ncbi:MAG: hypothetical protein OEX13_12215 [Gammaproteobacteria bacterium]|nr:hypothetical protein [Gammaproteobacteria bacterium]
MFRSGSWPRICLLGAVFAAEAAHSVGQEVADIPFFDALPWAGASAWARACTAHSTPTTSASST